MYNNPYNNFFPYQNMGSNFARRGFLSSLTNHHINWSNILNNTQKTLNVINQAIPVYYQIKPIYNNAKTMLRMVNILRQDDKVPNSSNTPPKEEKNTSQGPVFFT